MTRVLVVDDEALTRTMVADLIRGCGHDVAVADSGEAALEQFRRERFDLVLTDVTMPGMDGIDLGKALVRVAPGTPVVLISSNDELGVFEDAARRGFQPSGFIPKPLDRAGVLALIGRTLAPPDAPWLANPATDSEDDADGWLASTRCPVAARSPLRVLFVAQRQKASGSMRVIRAAGASIVRVRAGAVVGVEGVPGLFRALHLPDDTADLMTGVRSGLTAGRTIDECLLAATEGLAAWLGTVQDAPEGTVTWAAGLTVPPGAAALPGGVTRWCAAANVQRSPSRLEAAWAERMAAPVTRRDPTDAPEAAWGLDPLALRVHRIAASPRTIAELLHEVSNGDPARRIAALRTVDLLTALGLLRVGAAPAPAAPAAPKADDPRLPELREADARFAAATPAALFELDPAAPLAEAELTRAFHKASRAYHPDLYFGAPAEVQALAARCFTRMNDAYTALRAPAALDEWNKRAAAAATGTAFSSERDVMAARIAFKKGEQHWRLRDHAGADPHLALAARLDPATWPYVFYAAQTGYYTRRLTLAQALAALDGLPPLHVVRQAEVHAAAAVMLRADGKEADAQVRFKRALTLDPANRDALRDQRLQASRAAAPPPEPGLAARLSSLFKRG